MPSIQEILGANTTERERITALKQKTVSVPVWAGRKGLESEYDPKKHPVMDKQIYPDIVRDDGVERVTRKPSRFRNSQQHA